jgi:hypothetical protein
MDRNITDSQAAFLAACAERGYDPDTLIPDTGNMPEWLARYTSSSIKRLIIAEAINNGRVRKPGQETVYFPVWDLTDNTSGLGFSSSDYDSWSPSTGVGSRLEFFNRTDSDFFGSNFMDLHADVLLPTINVLNQQSNETETV